MRKVINSRVLTYITESSEILASLPVEDIMAVLDVVIKVREEGRRVFLIGNGGSASTASHFASDLCKGARCPDKPPIRAFALTDNMALFSAWANDTSYDNTFAQQIDNLVEPDDVVIGLSGSGNSINIIKAMLSAKQNGATTIGFTGFDGGKLKSCVDIAIIVPSNNMEHIEDIHLLLEHLITTCLRSED